MTNHSFAVMAYKNSPFLSDCLDSLLNQTVKSNIYITTSTPTDHIMEIAKKYNIEVFITDSDRGIAHDWNFSLEQATTKYVTLAHQDDIYLPTYTENCINKAEKFNDTLICFTDYSEMVDNVERKNTLMLRTKRIMLKSFMPFKRNIKSKFWKKISQSFGSPIPCPSVMYNRKNLGSFRFAEDYSISLDWDAWLRMAEITGRFVYVPKLLLQHRIHKSSATTAGINSNVRQNEDYKIYSRIWPGFIVSILMKFYSKSYKSNEI